MTVLFDHHGPNADKPTHPAPAFPLPNPCWEDDRHLIYSTEIGTGTQLVRLDVVSGKGEPLALADGEEDGRPAATTPSERRRRLLTLMPSGDDFLKDRSLARSTVVRWKGTGGLEIEGILTTPPAETGKRPPYKLVVYPHGGPHGRSTLEFDFTTQVLAAAGYAVLRPNYRGSAGYGQEFIDADRNDFGGGDMRDILAGVDDLIRQGVADRDHLFVYGTSYGGYLTCWLVGHTDRFKAAVAQNAVTDLTMMWSLSDLHSWTEWEFGGRPWEVPEKMRQHSPLTFADKVRTPTLILHSRDDRRCPLPMGVAFYQALRANGTPTAMVVYPDEGHGIRQPRHREDVLRRVLDWFAQHDR